MANPHPQSLPSTLPSLERPARPSLGSRFLRGAETSAFTTILSPSARFMPRGRTGAEAEVERERFSPPLPGCEHRSHQRAPGQQQPKARLRAVTCYFPRYRCLPAACVAVRVRARARCGGPMESVEAVACGRYSAGSCIYPASPALSLFPGLRKPSHQSRTRSRDAAHLSLYAASRALGASWFLL